MAPAKQSGRHSAPPANPSRPASHSPTHRPSPIQPCPAPPRPAPPRPAQPRPAHPHRSRAAGQTVRQCCAAQSCRHPGRPACTGSAAGVAQAGARLQSPGAGGRRARTHAAACHEVVPRPLLPAGRPAAPGAPPVVPPLLPQPQLGPALPVAGQLVLGGVVAACAGREAGRGDGGRRLLTWARPPGQLASVLGGSWRPAVWDPGSPAPAREAAAGSPASSFCLEVLRRPAAHEGAVARLRFAGELQGAENGALAGGQRLPWLGPRCAAAHAAGVPCRSLMSAAPAHTHPAARSAAPAAAGSRALPRAPPAPQATGCQACTRSAAGARPAPPPGCAPAPARPEGTRLCGAVTGEERLSIRDILL